MMHVPAYIAARFGYRALEFLRQWYVESFFFARENVLAFAALLNKRFRIAETFLRFFSPPHRGEALPAYVLQHVLTVFVATAGALFLACVTLIGVLLYVVWLALPVAALSGLIRSLYI